MHRGTPCLYLPVSSTLLTCLQDPHSQSRKRLAENNTCAIIRLGHAWPYSSKQKQTKNTSIWLEICLICPGRVCWSRRLLLLPPGSRTAWAWEACYFTVYLSGMPPYFGTGTLKYWINPGVWGKHALEELKLYALLLQLMWRNRRASHRLLWKHLSH